MFEDAGEFLKKIQRGENRLLEFKEIFFAGNKVKAPRRQSLADEMAAFANASGGELLLGINDKTRDIIGIPDHLLTIVEDFVVESARTLVDPPIDPLIDQVEIPDSLGNLQTIVQVRVEKGLSVHRSPSGYLRRVGSSMRQLGQDELVRLFQQRSQSRLIRYDETPVPNTRQEDWAPELVERFSTPRTSDDLGSLAQKLGMLVPNDEGLLQLTIAGVLLATDRPDRWLPNAIIQAVSYRGVTISPSSDEPNYQLDAADISGPIDSQVLRACQFVGRNQRVAASKRLGRTDSPEYDMTAIFEALVNAVAHRDYSIRAKIRLRMFSDRLEIYSPGSLVNTMTTETLALRQASRNEAITSLLAKCVVPRDIPGLETTRSTLMDRRGEGVQIILDRSESLSQRPPKYETIDESELRLTIFSAFPMRDR